MSERAEAGAAARVRNGNGALWLDSGPDQSEGSACLHSSRGVNPLREPWPRSKPVAKGRTKPTLALSPALCTPMVLFTRQHRIGTCPWQQSGLFSDSWLTVATSTLISATLFYATVWMVYMWISTGNRSCVCIDAGQSFWMWVFAGCKNKRVKWIFYIIKCYIIMLWL